MANWIDREIRYAHYIAEGLQEDGSGLHCAICGVEVIPGEHTRHPQCATLDHKIPRKISGMMYDTRPENLVTTCGFCNGSRKDRALDAYLDALPEHQASAARAEIARRATVKASGMRPFISESLLRGYARRRG